MTRTLRLSLACLAFLLFGVGQWVQAQNDDVGESIASESSVSAASEQPTASATTSTPLPTSGQQTLSALPSGADVAVIPVQGLIYGFTLDSLERRVDRAIAAGATVIVLEIDTPGGVVTDAIAISRYLKELQGVTTVAWIRNEAYSAGSLIATACDAIVVSPSSSFGDSAPVSLAGDLAPTERAKALSPLLEAYKDNARANGYDYAPLHAMCVLGVEVFYVEHRQTGQRRLVNQADFAVMVDGESPQAVEDALTAGLSADDELAQVGAPRVSVMASEAGQWKPVETLPSGRALPNGRVHDGTTLYTLSQTEAVDVGLAVAIVADEAALRQRLNAANVYRVDQRFIELAAYWATHPLVRGILVLVVLVGAYIEFQAPGLGIGGALALISLVILVVAPFLIGLAEVWHVLLLVLGLMLLITEIVATPTFGLLGVVGVVMMLAGLALSIVPTGGGGALPMPAAGTGDTLIRSAVSMVLAFALAVGAMVALTFFYGSIPFLNRLVLDNADVTTPRPGEPHDIAGDHALGGGLALAVGTTAVVSETGLRPSGRIDVDGTLVDAVSTGGFLDPGVAVSIVEITGNRVVVDEA